MIHPSPRSAASAALCALLLALPTASRAWDVPATLGRIDATLAQAYPKLDALYKDIHGHPELGFMEVATAGKLAAEMRAMGFEVTEGVGQTGLVAIYRNGPGKTVLVRTEMDALPMEEKTGLPYASTVKTSWNGSAMPVAHSCGHDIHMAAWVGTARALLDLKGQWKGTLMFIAQPAEETVNGATRMLKDGLFTRWPKPDAGFGLHVGAAPAGEVTTKAGVLTSNSDSFEITFKGRGGHGSMPSVTIDPVLMASRFVVDVQSVVSREKNAADFGVVTVGAIQGGSAGNIIPDSTLVRGTVRSYQPEVRKVLLAGLNRTAKAVADMAGAPAPDITVTPGGNAVVNDDDLTGRTARLFKTAFGDKAKTATQPGAASEDFSEYIIAGVPSVFFSIGGIDPAKLAELKAAGKPVPANHNPGFAPTPEPAIRTGVRAMTLAVMDVMQ